MNHPVRAFRRRGLTAFGLAALLALSGCATSAGPSSAPAPQVAPMETGPVQLVKVPSPSPSRRTGFVAPKMRGFHVLEEGW